MSKQDSLQVRKARYNLIIGLGFLIVGAGLIFALRESSAWIAALPIVLFGILFSGVGLYTGSKQLD